VSDVMSLFEKRQSTRSPFDPGRAIPKEALQKILEAARWSPTAHNMQNFEVVVVDDRKLLEGIAGIKSPVSEVFIRENYEQLSFSEDELRKKKVGILGTMFPASWRTPGAAPKADADSESMQNKLVQMSSALLVVLYDPSRRAPASEGDFLGIMSLGCVMQNMWLAAQAQGIGFQIISSLSGDYMEGIVKRMLGVPLRLRIAFSARLGYPVRSSPYLRVRRDIKDFTHHNRYDVQGL